MSFFANKPILKRLLPLIVALLILIVFGARGYLMTLNYDFSGKIEKIEYPDSLKHIPTITVEGKKYDLVYCDLVNYRDPISLDSANNRNYRDSLFVGDSVVKKKAV